MKSPQALEQSDISPAPAVTDCDRSCMEAAEAKTRTKSDSDILVEILQEQKARRLRHSDSNLKRRLKHGKRWLSSKWEGLVDAGGDEPPLLLLVLQDCCVNVTEYEVVSKLVEQHCCSNSVQGWTWRAVGTSIMDRHPHSGRWFLFKENRISFSRKGTAKRHC